MLKLNILFSSSMLYHYNNLNTSYVKAKQAADAASKSTATNLNTSYVKAKHV